MQRLEADRLDQMGMKSGIATSLNILFHTEATQGNRRDLLFLAEFSQQIDATPIRETNVADKKIEWPGASSLNCASNAVGCFYLIASTLKHDFHHLARINMVVNDQYL